MNSTTDVHSFATARNEQPEYLTQYREKFNQYMEKQPGIIRILHDVMKVFALLCMVLVIIMFVFAIYHTIRWAATGDVSRLGEVWANYGLSMSFLVFPWGLDSMLLRAFPAFPYLRTYKPRRPINFFTGLGAFFAGFGITCAGAPGAVRMFELASQAIQKLF